MIAGDCAIGHKFEVVGLLDFHKVLLLSHVSDFPFQNLHYICSEG